ncbi:hypothetical protein BHE74_00024898 [Ensete ventricosum]|nr:hypothetical protein BHE74_00024898 [Ensete ventricosum]
MFWVVKFVYYLIFPSLVGRTRSLVANWERREHSPTLTYDQPRLSNSSETGATSSSTYSLVCADVLSSLKDKSEIISLDICASLLPLLTGLLESKIDRYASISFLHSYYLFWLSIYPILFALHCRHLGVSLEMLLKLVKIFVPVIRSTLSAGPSVGVDLQAEKRFSFGRYDSTTIFSIHGRLERCNLCFIELEKIKNNISSLIR